MLDGKTTGHDGIKAEKKNNQHKSRHRRYRINATVGLVRGGIPERIFVRALNLSWSGAMLRVPNTTIARRESVVLRFPGTNNDQISARAEVVWSCSADDQHSLIGVRFTKLRVADEEKLRRLLSILSLSQPETEQDTRIPREIEIFTVDRKETIAPLEQICAGRLEITLVGSIPANEPFPLAVEGFGAITTLRLRARALSQEAQGSSDSANSLRMQRVILVFDHPEGDLKRIIEPLIAALHAHDDVVVFNVA